MLVLRDDTLDCLELLVEMRLALSSPITLEARVVVLVPVSSSVVSVSVVSVVVVLSVLFEPSSLLLLQEMIVKLKRNMEKMMSICLNWFPISVLGEPNIYHNLEDFTRTGDFTWRVVNMNLLLKNGQTNRQH